MLAKALDKLNRRPDAIAALEAYRRAGGWDPALCVSCRAGSMKPVARKTRPT